MEVQIVYSHGRGSGGKLYAYVRPANDCFNRSRRVGGFTGAELEGAIQMCIEKWFTPCNYYLVEGCVIGSNSEKNALKEYWKVCDLKDMNQPFDVQLLPSAQELEREKYEALMQQYSDLTLQIIKDAVKGGSTPGQVEKMFQLAVDHTPGSNPSMPKDAAVLAVYFWKQCLEKPAPDISMEQHETISESKFRGRSF
ncbi:hypothetical protein V9K67_21600 [Paraflavisolibacter sp. H34]|uniref:hypothetical protein n=1 Tax=Huijunlia imazamoxiresistens TaxID=3127457 RepID=UPI00301B45C2